MTIKSDSTVAIIQLAQLGPRGVVFSTLWIQNLTETTLSVFEINIIFHFHQNSRWQQKIGKVLIFQRYYSSSTKYPGGPKFGQNRSISDGF